MSTYVAVSPSVTRYIVIAQLLYVPSSCTESIQCYGSSTVVDVY